MKLLLFWGLVGVALLASYLTPSSAVPAGSKQGLAYCLGKFEEDERIFYALAERGHAAAPRKSADRLHDKAQRIRQMLTRLGVSMAVGTAEQQSYADGHEAALTCFGDEITPCVQMCFKTHRDIPSENCEQICGMPQHCKLKFDCYDSPVAATFVNRPNVTTLLSLSWPISARPR